jgi:uncharacterized Tic20 family protein
MNWQTSITIWAALSISSAILNHGFMLAFFWNQFPSLQSRERFQELHIRQILPFFLVMLCPMVVILTIIGGMAKYGTMYRYPHK